MRGTMQFNFFNWVREGVRQAVLLGVSDAVEQLGVPPESEDVSKRLSGLLQTSEAAPALKRSEASSSRPKRLGRSLKDIEQETK